MRTARVIKMKMTSENAGKGTKNESTTFLCPCIQLNSSVSKVDIGKSEADFEVSTMFLIKIKNQVLDKEVE